jgi:hypothetical protein
MSALSAVIVAEEFRGFPESLRASSGIEPRVRPRRLPKSFQFFAPQSNLSALYSYSSAADRVVEP